MNKLTTTLNNGVEIPLLGFGTYKLKDGEEVINAVLKAIEIGYRHIDTAAVYENEWGVGEALSKSGIPRGEIFLTSKVWNTHQGYETTIKAFEDSLDRLGTDYLDLYLIHWPKELNMETWKAMEELYKDGKIRAIGVSNFKEHHLEELFKTCQVMPMVNQVEMHPRFPQTKLREYCDKYDIKVEAWAPLMQGEIFKYDVINDIAKKHGRTPAEIALRWIYQNDVISLCKSSHEDRIKSNYNIFGFQLDSEDMKRISELDENKRVGPDPDNIDF